MKRKFLTGILVLSSYLLATASAQRYSIQEAMLLPEGRQALKSQPIMIIGSASKQYRFNTVSGKSKIAKSARTACQQAAIKALAELQKNAIKRKYRMIKNIHSPNASTGAYFCNIGKSSVSVVLRGRFTIN